VAKRNPICEILADHGRITAAITDAVRDAVQKHAQAGNPVSTWKDGKVVWLQPAEVFALLAETPPPTTISK